MNFYGERLKKARIFRNLSISDLEKKISVTKQAISQYEKNLATPKPETMFELVSALRFPMAFFTNIDKNETEIENTFFRAKFTTKALDLETQEVKTTIIVQVYKFLNEYLNFPQLDLPRYVEETFDFDEIAENLRAYWNIGFGPITNMVALLEKKGIIVSSLMTDNQKIDAFTQVSKINDYQYYCVVLGNDKQSMVRRNFDAAHELGHILLHSKTLSVKELSKEEDKDMEKEANNFAASFLLPKNTFYSDLRDPINLDSYIELKKKWKVSIAAMIMRARQLGRINQNQYQNLMKLMSYRKWRKSEPFDTEWEMPQPQLFKTSINLLIKHGVLTTSQILTEFAREGWPIYAEDLEVLLNLEKGTFNDSVEKNNGIIIKLRQ